MKTRAEALAMGMKIDDSSAGRPWAYKGPRFSPTLAFPIHTDLETALMERLENLEFYITFNLENPLPEGW